MSTQNPIYGTEIPQPNFQNASPGAAPGQGTYSPPPNHPMYYQPYYQPEKSNGCGTFLFRFVIVMVVLSVIGLFGLMFVSLMAGNMEQVALQDQPALQEKFLQGSRTAKNKVVVLRIEGVITGSEDGFIARQIKRATADKNVKAIVIRVESPGGTMTGSDYYHYLLTKLRKEKPGIPIVVSMGSIAASGGYYVSMVSDRIYAEPTTITGSIGVIVSLYNGAELLNKVGIESTPITSGPMKTMSSFAKPLSDEEREIWQRLVDDSFDRFKSVIRDGRKKFKDDPDLLDELATGQIYTANEAKENGLIDEIGYLDDVIANTLVMAGLSSRDSKVVRYQTKKSLMEVMLEARGPGNPLDKKAITHLTTPRLLLLCPQVVPIQE